MQCHHFAGEARKIDGCRPHQKAANVRCGALRGPDPRKGAWCQPFLVSSLGKVPGGQGAWYPAGGVFLAGRAAAVRRATQITRRHDRGARDPCQRWRFVDGQLEWDQTWRLAPINWTIQDGLYLNHARRPTRLTCHSHTPSAFSVLGGRPASSARSLPHTPRTRPHSATRLLLLYGRPTVGPTPTRHQSPPTASCHLALY